MNFDEEMVGWVGGDHEKRTSARSKMTVSHRSCRVCGENLTGSSTKEVAAVEGGETEKSVRADLGEEGREDIVYTSGSWSVNAYCDVSSAIYVIPEKRA